MLYLTEKQWNARMKTIETKNLHKYQKTPYWLTISQVFSDCIVEIQTNGVEGESVRVIDEERYKELKEYCQSENFVLRKE
ncbi:protein of unknown function [Ruminococcaceae bacterium BL-6]|nr:protein of unknown function [Ruminococcaceae bacterium BL-6]